MRELYGDVVDSDQIKSSIPSFRRTDAFLRSKRVQSILEYIYLSIYVFMQLSSHLLNLLCSFIQYLLLLLHRGHLTENDSKHTNWKIGPITESARMVCSVLIDSQALALWVLVDGSDIKILAYNFAYSL